MPGSILCIRDMGHENLWRVLHEAGLMADAQQRGSALRHRAAMLLFAAPSAEDRLSFSASIRQMEGQSVCLLSGEWRTDSASLALQAPLYGCHADFSIVHGLPGPALEVLAAHCGHAVLNGGNATGHPCAALADISLFRQHTPELDTVRVAWVGGVNGLAHSLIEAAMYVPFELFMALPEWGEPDHAILGLALKAGAKIFLTREPRLALDGAHYVYAGAGPQTGEGRPLQAGMPLTAELMQHARPHARVLSGLGLTPGCRVDEALLDMPLHTQRLEHRLRLQKALLPLLLTPAQNA